MDGPGCVTHRGNDRPLLLFVVADKFGHLCFRLIGRIVPRPSYGVVAV